LYGLGCFKNDTFLDYYRGVPRRGITMEKKKRERRDKRLTIWKDPKGGEKERWM
jgi:hypothetical protein